MTPSAPPPAAASTHVHPKKTSGRSPTSVTSLDSDPVSAHNNRGVLLCHAGKLKDAITQFYEALQHTMSKTSLSDCPETRDILVSAARPIRTLLEGTDDELCTQLLTESGSRISDNEDEDDIAIVPKFEPYDRLRTVGTASKTFRCMKISKEDEGIYSSLNIRQYDKRPSIIMLNTGIVLQKAGLNTQANEVYELAISFLQGQHQGVLDRNDYLVQASIWRNIGQLRLEKDDLQGSLVLFSDAFEAAQAHLSLVSKLNLNEEEAQRIKPSLERANAECLDIMISSLSNIGMIHYLLGDFYMASLVSTEAQDFVKDMPESHCDNISTVLYNLALVHSMEGHHQSALKEFNESLHKVIAQHGSSNHPLAAAALYRIGTIFNSQSRYNDSTRTLTSALSIREVLHGGIHNNVAGTLFMVGRVSRDQE